MTWENYAIDIGSCYYLTKHYWQLKLLKFLDATFKKQCNGLKKVLHLVNFPNKEKRKLVAGFWRSRCLNF